MSHMARLARVYYIAPVASQELNERYGQQRYVGAAAKKVFAVCRALRGAGISPVVVSTAMDRPKSHRRNRATRTDGVAYVRVYSVGTAWMRRIFSALTLLFFVLKVPRKGDRVLMYNFFPEYALAAAWLNFFGMAAILDVEDAPTSREPGLRGSTTRLSYQILKKLTAPRQVVASGSLAALLGLRTVCIVYGASRSNHIVHRPKFVAPRLNIHIGGTVNAGTGSLLFSAALKETALIAPDIPIDFHVTGHWDNEGMTALKKEVETSSNIGLFLYRALSASQYDALFAQMDVGLSLRLSTHEISDSTFPSKVVEITLGGLLLCSTCTSDIPELFDDESAILLREETPRALAQTFIEINGQRRRSARRAACGSARANELFNSNAVGNRLAAFLHG